MLDQMPAPGEPVTDGRPYLREEAPNEFVVQGVGYLPVMYRSWETFFRAGFGDRGQEDYPEWRDRFLQAAGASSFTPEMVAGMTRQDCRYLLRTIQRGERFCDGAWASAHAQGLFHAIARRLMELAKREDEAAGKQGNLL